MNLVNYLINNNDRCISCNKHAGIMRLRPPKLTDTTIFPSGKYEGELVSECTDLEYMKEFLARELNWQYRGKFMVALINRISKFNQW